MVSPSRERKRSRSRERSARTKESKRRKEDEERPVRDKDDKRREERPAREEKSVRDRGDKVDKAAREEKAALESPSKERPPRDDRDRERRQRDERPPVAGAAAAAAAGTLAQGEPRRDSRRRSRSRSTERKDRERNRRDAGEARGGDKTEVKSEPKADVKVEADITTSAAVKAERKEEREPDASKRTTSPLRLPQGNGSAVTPRIEPLSLEELLKKKKQQQEEDAKPKFLSKAQREALALAKRQEEVAVQRAQQELLRNGGRPLPGPPGISGSDLPPPPSRYDDRRDDRRHDDRRGNDRRLDERGGRDDRGGGRDDRRDDRAGRNDRSGEDGKRWQETRERERELELIKQQYLGQEKNKKKVLKPSEKFKFNFDWDAGDDTSKDLNPLYNATHQAALLYGRGMLAGIDRREQKKAAAQTEKEMMRRARQAAGISETNETRAQERERERLADAYGETGDMKVDKHWTEKALEDMTERDWRIFREDFNIAYKGTNLVMPIRNWDEAKLPKELRKAVDKAGYVKPSPIQMAAIPLGLQQRDVIGIAETGSGKTAAFVLPMLTYIMRQPPMTEATEADGPYSVVMAPTRELAQQIEDETVKLCEYTKFRVTSIVGGQSIEEQGSKLRRGCEIVIATPGRLIDCLERHYAVLNQCNYVVLDEADRMIDLGFEPQVMGVLDAMPSSNLKPEGDDSVLEADRVYRTTYMFSATMPPAVERLARKYLRRPCVVTIGTAGRATDNVTQKVYIVKENEKPMRLRQELDGVDEKRAIVFVNTKRQCDNVYTQLDQLGHRCTVLHSGRSQDQRSDSIKGFRTDVYNILIATDVAGRGIDVPDVALVINYDMANTTEAYTHRIGRTGRAGKKGIAATFLTMHDTEVFYDLKRLLEECKANVPPELARHEAAKQKPGAIGGVRRRDQTVFAKT